MRDCLGMRDERGDGVTAVTVAKAKAALVSVYGYRYRIIDSNSSGSRTQRDSPAKPEPFAPIPSLPK